MHVHVYRLLKDVLSRFLTVFSLRMRRVGYIRSSRCRSLAPRFRTRLTPAHSSQMHKWRRVYVPRPTGRLWQQQRLRRCQRPGCQWQHSVPAGAHVLLCIELASGNPLVRTCACVRACVCVCVCVCATPYRAAQFGWFLYSIFDYVWQ